MSFLCTHSPAGIFIFFFCLCLLRYNIFLLLHTFECLLHLIQKPHRFNPNLDHTGTGFIPGNGIHDLFSLGGIRRDILTHGKRFIFQHWFEIFHLLSGFALII